VETKTLASKMPTKYLKMFFAEKDLTDESWELADNNGTMHIISTGVVLEHFTLMGKAEADQIANTLRKIDFYNGDVNDFLKHLAGAIINGA